MVDGKNDQFEESSLSPTIASSSPNDGAADYSASNQNNDVQAARRGLLKAIWQATLAPRFSSRPIDLKTSNSNQAAGAFSSKPIEMEEYFSSNNSRGGSFVRQNSCVTVGTLGTTSDSSFIESSYLTPSEQGYLQELLQSDDLNSIRRASVRLSDKEIFPSATDEDDEIEVTNEGSSDNAPHTTKRKTMPLPPTFTPPRRRDSQVQEHLLEWHEKTTIMPSVVLQRMSSNQSAKKTTLIPRGISSRSISQDDSLTQDDSQDSSSDCPSVTSNATGGEENKFENKERVQEKTDHNENQHDREEAGVLQHECKDGTLENEQTWNFDLIDLNAWVARTEGVEVNEEGHASTTANMTSNPFKILGTSANDVSVQPMVLSPPLMEGLQSFMPESFQEHHYWLKYSLVRDGPGLMKMLRHCRGSQHTILAIETTDGYVFGSFTAQPWRLTSPNEGSDHYYGSKESFLWRMRQSRFEPCESVVEQILMESKMDVFPFTSQNNMVQSCTKSGIALGHGEIKEEVKTEEGEEDEEPNLAGDDTKSTNPAANRLTDHYGHAIKLDRSMATGSTSSSETFGSPCMIERESRGKQFQVANVELWTMTPHESVEDADQAEMRALFLEENRDKNLNLIEILVGTHKS
uniref:Oxidation resistance protein 1 n=1 Tax=Pseudo-nitzschia australis TaxID=44445 RepID=A0A7S4EQB8_9STRA|mmetsp:Transcript_19202/g.41725  ORF Transcript_19202/g.41725 Transcript_19202/m.41725 type:complete len:633 (-) Transcript_19202:87-1985(-)